MSKTLITKIGFKSSYTFSRPANTTAYGELDVISNSATNPTIISFEGVTEKNGSFSTIDQVTIVSDNPQSQLTPTLLLFNDPVASGNDNEALSLSAADSLKIITVRSLSETIALGSGWASVLNSPIKISPTTTTLYAMMVDRFGFYQPISGETFTITITGEFF